MNASRLRPFLPLLFLFCAVSCGDDNDPNGLPQRTPFFLTDQAAWKALSEQDDPFAGEGLYQDCVEGGFKVETTILEVETDICPYVTLTQTTKQEILAGDEIEFSFWHLVLVAEMPAEAHVVIKLGDYFEFEQTITIPSSEMIYPVRWEASETIPSGTKIYFHLHNHGFNSYRLSEIEVTPGS